MNARIEHVNMHVKDVDQMLKFINTAFPHFKIRFDSNHDDKERWVHIGSEETYLAIYQATQEDSARPNPYSGKPQVNHLGYVVDDVEALRQRLLDAGYEESTLENNHPARKRIYFFDPDGNDWEFIEYLSNDPKQQNDYSE